MLTLDRYPLGKEELVRESISTKKNTQKKTNTRKKRQNILFKQTKMQQKNQNQNTCEPKITAPSSRNKVKLLVKLKLPVTHLPSGTFNRAPPLSPKRCTYLIAFRNASVLDVFPSPTPPKSLIDITAFLSGNSPKNPTQVLESAMISSLDVEDVNAIFTG